MYSNHTAVFLFDQAKKLLPLSKGFLTPFFGASPLSMKALFLEFLPLPKHIDLGFLDAWSFGILLLRPGKPERDHRIVTLTFCPLVSLTTRKKPLCQVPGISFKAVCTLGFIRSAQGESIAELQELKTIASSCLHTIRNSLSAISTLSQLGVLTPEGRKKDEALKKILTQVDNLACFLSKLGSLTRERTEEFSWSNPYALLEKVAKAQEASFYRKSASLTWDLTPLLGEVSLAPLSFQEAFTEILKNALESIDVGGTIGIESMLSPSALCFRVRDTGSGMQKNALQMAATPFWSTKNGHSGLGLSLAYQVLVLQHKGRLFFQSTREKGTTVIVELPRKLLQNSIERYPEH